MTDSSLLIEIKKNNIACYEQLIRKYTPYVIAIIYKISSQRLKDEDIEEITSDVFVKLWEIRANLEIQVGKEKAYIGKMTRNITLNALKKKSLHESLPLEENQIWEGEENVDKFYLKEEEKQIISETINRIPEPDREIFIRRYFYFQKIKQNEAVNIQPLLQPLDDYQKNPKRSKKISQSKYKRSKKILLVAALCIALGSVVGAVGINETIKEFFGEHLELILPNTQEVNKSFTHNGITMNVETAVAGNSNGIIIIRLTKEDGTPFKEGSELKKFKVTVDESRSMGYSHGWQMSEDNKQMTYIITINTDEDLVGKRVCVTGEEIVIVSPKEEEVAINLEEVEQKPVKEVVELSSGEAYIVGRGGTETEGIDLYHPYSDIVLSDIGFSEGMFYVEMEYTDTEYEPWQLFRLIDTRTNEELENSSSESYWSSSDNEDEKTVQTNRRFFEDITTADLPYLKLVKMYNEYEEVTTGTWQVEFTLEKNKNVKRTKKKYKIPFEEDSLLIKEVEISAVGGKINGIIQLKRGEGQRPDFVDKIDIVLKMKDGTEQSMTTTLSSYGGHGDEYSAQIQLGKPWHQHTEEEKEKLREEGRANKYKRNQGIDGLFPYELIDVNEVESIQIEEMTIPLY